MTTALIGKRGSPAARARIALVSHQGFGELASALSRAGHDPHEIRDWADFANGTQETGFDLIVCDAASAEVLPEGLPVPVLRCDEHGNVDETTLQPLLLLAVELRAAAQKCVEFERIVQGLHTGTALVGSTPALRRMQAAVARAADCDATVLIEGPVGAGKSLAARMIHLKSRRCATAMTALEAGDVGPDELVQALDAARQSTVVLENVDRLPAATQSALVKHLKERSSPRAGSQARLIATTSAHVPELVARGAFREDLFYRLHAFPIMVPSLRERVEDIAPLAEALLDASVPATGQAHQGITPAARMLLESMPWPGNVAQLEATVRRAQALAAGAPIDRQHLLAPAPGAGVPTPAAASAATTRSADDAELTEDDIRPFEQEEQILLGRALRATKGNVRRAAQLLGIGRATLYRKIQQYRLRLH